MYVARKSTQAPPPRRFLRKHVRMYIRRVWQRLQTRCPRKIATSLSSTICPGRGQQQSQLKKLTCCRQISHSADTTWQAARLWSALGFVYYCPGKKVALGQSWRTGRYYYWYLAWLMGTRTTAPMGGSVECHPCDARCSPGSIIQTGVSAGA